VYWFSENEEVAVYRYVTEGSFDAGTISRALMKRCYLFPLLSTLVILGWGEELLLFWVISYVTSFVLVNWYIELFEHFPFVKQVGETVASTATFGCSRIRPKDEPLPIRSTSLCRSSPRSLKPRTPSRLRLSAPHFRRGAGHFA
jgi:hypothetical protein